MLRQTHYSTLRTIEKLQIIHNIIMQCNGIEQVHLQRFQIEEKCLIYHETTLHFQTNLQKQIIKQNSHCIYE